VNAPEPVVREPGVAVVDVLRDAIRQRLLAPGAPLVQASLASALGVSKIPVREALHSLAAEGLVTFTDEGVRVVALSPAEVHELWSLRALIEPALAGAIVRNAGPADVRALGELVARMDAADDGDAWSDLNFVFHLELARIADLPHYAAVARRVLTLIEPHSRVAVNRLAGRDAAQAEHREMLAAVEARDAERLRAVLEVHATRARDLLVGFAERERDTATSVSAAAEAARSFVARLTPPPAAP
jgi:DNA-binding GntR family transcriptional regulator